MLNAYQNVCCSLSEIMPIVSKFKSLGFYLIFVTEQA